MDYTDCEKKIRSYFDTAVKELQRKHNPATAKEAAEFALILEYMEAHPEKAELEAAKDMGGRSDYMTLALNELAGADKCWRHYEHIGDDRFRQIAKAKLAASAALQAIMDEQGMKADVQDIKNRRMALEKIIR